MAVILFLTKVSTHLAYLRQTLAENDPCVRLRVSISKSPHPSRCLFVSLISVSLHLNYLPLMNKNYFSAF